MGYQVKHSLWNVIDSKKYTVEKSFSTRSEAYDWARSQELKHPNVRFRIVPV